jgi:hypothetical protein
MFARLVWFLSFIIFEIIVFSIIVGVVSESSPALASILTVVFIIWIIAEITIRIFVGGGKSLIRWIFRF